MRLSLSVDGRSLEVSIEAEDVLLDVLRRHGHTAPKEGCGVGVCGLCSVLLDGRPVSACLYLAACAQGSEVVTAAGVAERDPALADAFLRHQALQCGICTPGQLVAAAALKASGGGASEAEIREFMAGNLCRCTGYGAIVEAVAEALRAGR